MKTFRRVKLPNEIRYNNKIYEVNIKLSALYAMGRRKAIPQEAIEVEVLSSRLRGKTDYYGNEYNPSIFIFTPVNNEKQES